MSINQLPRELTPLILQHLSPVDRLNSSLTCREWAEDVSLSSSLEDVWRIIYGSDTETVIRSRRRYRNIRIFGADLSNYNVAFWEKVGRYLRRLELIDCDSTPEVFNSITRHCPELKSLEVKGYAGIFDGMVFRENIFSARLGDKSDKVQHLATDIYMIKEIIEHLLTSMPHATSISLRFRDSLHLLPCILKTGHTFTKLELFARPISGENVIALVGMYSESLQVLRLSLHGLSDHAAYSAIGDCRKLRHLTLIGAHGFADSHLEKVVRNAPELETLDFYLCNTLTDVGLAYIHNLKGLRNLGIRWVSNLTIDALRRAGGIPTLRRIDFDHPHITSRIDITVLRNIGSLKDLRALHLRTLLVDSESFDIICGNLGMLEELSLSECGQLTNADAAKLCRLTRLKSLRLGQCYQLTDLAFAQGLGSPAMESLYVGSCSLSRVGLASIAAHHGRLRRLKFLSCREITDAGFATFLRREPFLEKLFLSLCESLTDGCLKYFGNKCPRLRYLELSSMNFSPEAVAVFKRQRPLVRVSVR